MSAVGPATTLAELTTLRVGGPVGELVEATTEAELVEAVAEVDAAGTPVLVVSGGSNLLCGDAGFDGRVVLVRTRGIDAEVSDCAGATVTVAAGEPWDELVARSVEAEWVGLAPLSGIPGLTGATPLQNVGAYGADVSQTIARVTTWDRVERRRVTVAAADCDFAYRHSRFKAEPGRHLVLSVTFQFELGRLSAPVAYAELARRLGVEVGERAPSAEVRDAVLDLRRGKGMVLDAADHDTWSAGSFFTNPILTSEQAERLDASAPRYPQPDGRIKTSAAWLISASGFEKGHGNERASLSTRHSLALTNRGTATAADVVALAREVRDGVEAATGVRLEPEPVRVNCEV